MQTWITLRDLCESDRWDPHYWHPDHTELDDVLRRLKAQRLGAYIDSITYGQVGARRFTPDGPVRYLQVINIRATGIDFLLKPDRLAEGSYNDIARSRLRKDDLLFTNTAFGGTQTLLGRCIVVPVDYGLVNISQDIDLIRVRGIDPYYVAAFIKTSYGQRQVQRLKYGVRSNKLSFGQVRDLRIPRFSETVEHGVRTQYLAMAEAHGQAMERKQALFDRHGVVARDLDELAQSDPSFQRHAQEAQRRHDHLLAALAGLIAARTLESCPLIPSAKP